MCLWELVPFEFLFLWISLFSDFLFLLTVNWFHKYFKSQPDPDFTLLLLYFQDLHLHQTDWYVRVCLLLLFWVLPQWHDCGTEVGQLCPFWDWRSDRHTKLLKSICWVNKHPLAPLSFCGRDWPYFHACACNRFIQNNLFWRRNRFVNRLGLMTIIIFRLRFYSRWATSRKTHGICLSQNKLKRTFLSFIKML